MGKRCWELVAADKSAVITKPFLDAVVMEDSQGDRRFADPSGTYVSDGFEVSSEINNLLD